jgi:hypothetical protein
LWPPHLWLYWLYWLYWLHLLYANDGSAAAPGCTSSPATEAFGTH